MKQGKSRNPPAALPKALLPDPDSLLHHIDRALVATEYARATQDLGNIPPGPIALNPPSKSSSSHAQSAVKDSEEARRNPSTLPASVVDNFLQKVITGKADPGASKGRKASNAVTPSSSHYSKSSARSASESSASQTRDRIVRVRSFSSIPTNPNSEPKLSLDSRVDYGVRDLAVEFLSTRSTQGVVQTSTGTKGRFNSTSQDMQRDLVVPKLPFFKPVRPDLNPDLEVYGILEPDDSSLENDGFNGNKSSKSAEESFLRQLSLGSRKMLTRSLDFSTNMHNLGSKNLTETLVQRLESRDDAVPQYDAAAADQAYRAGSAAMEEGDMVQAISFLRLASSKCPRDRPSALTKIQKLITAAEQQLEMQEASGSIAEPVPSTELQPKSVEELGRQLPMKILAVGDMLKADEAYRAGVAALEAGEPEKALEHLQRATLACPEDRLTAACKIQTLIEQANFELKMRLVSDMQHNVLMGQ